MNRFLAITIAAVAFAAGGCGEDPADTAQDQAEQAVTQGRDQIEQLREALPEDGR